MVGENSSKLFTELHMGAMAHVTPPPTANKSKFNERRVYFASQYGLSQYGQASGNQKLEAADHISSTVRKQGKMNYDVQPAFPLVFTRRCSVT